LSAKGAGLIGGIIFGLSGFLQLLAIFLWSDPSEYLLAIIWGCGFFAGLLISSGMSGIGSRGNDLYVWGGLLLAGMVSMAVTEYLRDIDPTIVGVSVVSAVLAFVGIFLATAPKGSRY